MNVQRRTSARFVSVISLILPVSSLQSEEPTLDEIKAAAAAQSRYLSTNPDPASNDAPEPDLEGFRAEIAPILAASCVECHGPEDQNAELRVDSLDPDLVHGMDVDWWLKVLNVLSNGEMPPEDGPELTDDDRNTIITWLYSEIQVASQVRRSDQGHSSFRRMTRYEYNYALQDLLGLDLDFAKDLPLDPVSEDGFRNSSGLLQMSASQYGTYLVLNRNALNRATVRGERPEVLYWGVSAERASAQKFRRLDEGKANSPTTGHEAGRRGRSVEAAEALTTRTRKPARRCQPPGLSAARSTRGRPLMTRPEVPEPSEYMAVLPAGERLVVELGNRLPDEGTLRVRIRASRGFHRRQSCSQRRSGVRLAGARTTRRPRSESVSRDVF